LTALVSAGQNDRHLSSTKQLTPAQQAHFVSHHAVFTQHLQAQFTNWVCNFYSKAHNNVTQQNKLHCPLDYLPQWWVGGCTDNREA